MPSASRVPLFVLVFSLLFLFSLGVVIAEEFSDVKWVQIIVRIAEGLGRLTFVSVAMAFILVEGIPMLAAWYKKQMIKEAEEKGREEGLAQGLQEGLVQGLQVGREEGIQEGLAKGQEWERQAWREWRSRMREWEHRRTEAERTGAAFVEPPPPYPDAEQRNSD